MQTKFENEKKNLLLEVDEDGFSAYLTIKDNGKFINEGDVLSLLAQANIKEGIVKASDFLKTQKSEKTIDEPFPIALGERSIEPSIEFSTIFDNENTIHPEEFNNQFDQLENLERVEANQPLAHLFITKPGKSGRNIFGESSDEISDHKALELYLGKNVHYSEEQSQIVSSVSGYPYIDDLDRVHVFNEFHIQENMGLNYENLELHGNLTVDGDIHEKIHLIIHGNLTVNGDINDAKIEVDDTLRVYGDILNCKENEIKSQGNIVFSSAENSNIYAAKMLSFSGHAQFCHIVAGKGIKGDKENSSIIGGLAQSGENIEVSVIGSTNSLSTEVEIGISPFIKEELLIITKKIMNLKGKPVENADKLQELTEKQQNLENTLEEAINNTLFNNDPSPKHIIVFNKIFPGTYLRILKKSQTVVDELNRVSFSVIDGELNIDSFN